MIININWATKVITIPQASLSPVSGSLYELDVDEFRLSLKDIEDSEDGMSFPDTHSHNTETVLSGTTYARSFQIINGYTVTFQDVGSPYTVRCVGANHNIGDVKNNNQVSLIIGNSAGLIVTSGGGGGGGSAPTVAQIRAEMDQNSMIAKFFMNKRILDPSTGLLTVYDNDGTTVLFSIPVYEDAARTQLYRGQGVESQNHISR